MPEPFTTYFDQESLPLPFCPGCGHTVILEQLDAALVQLQLDPQKWSSSPTSDAAGF